MTFDDTFNGDNAALLESIGALLRLAQSGALVPPVPGMPLQLLACAASRLSAADAKLNSPELHDFAAGVALEAAHQRERWGAAHDAGKEPEDWFWLLGWLGGKAARAAREGDREKALHHCVSTAAALANWHASILGVDQTMRPGIDPEARGYSIAS